MLANPLAAMVQELRQSQVFLGKRSTVPVPQKCLLKKRTNPTKVTSASSEASEANQCLLKAIGAKQCLLKAIYIVHKSELS